MVKKICVCLLLMAMMVPALALADAQVLDRANVIDADMEQQISERIDMIEQDHQIDLVVLTTRDTPYDGTEDLYYVRNYADDFFDNGGYGMGPDDSGMLILLDMHNRAVWLSTGGVMQEYINDDREESILDDCYEYLQYGDYGTAMDVAISRVGYYMDRGRAEGTFLYDEVTGERLSGIYNALTEGEVGVALIAGIAVVAVTLLSVKGSYSLKGSTYSYDRAANSTLNMKKDKEHFLRETVTRTARASASNNGGGSGGGGRSSGGSGVHRSSGGVSHGGGGRRF